MTFARLLAVAVVASFFAGCGDSDKPYTPKPAWSGTPVALPDVPTLPAKPPKIGDAYTVQGASHHLRSVVHSKEVKGKEITIIGHVVKTNFGDAPECAVHPTGKADPDGCKPPIPAIWIADEKGDTKKAMKVLGFASNFAQLYDAIKKDKRAKEGDDPTMDEFLGTPLPRPTPNVGAKVKITGSYSYAYTKATSGIETDPRFGILTYSKLEYIEPPPEPATLPGMK
ncbi:MAG: hypothetical protein CSA75_03300 [Sorangium cellulosum]|nr:MAG: hypothetical protein CSA75_03300 [Sorangium cellulosum]